MGSVLCIHYAKFGYRFSPIFSSVFPTSVFLDCSGLLLGGAGPFMLDSILGMDYPLFPWFCFEVVGLQSPGITEGWWRRGRLCSHAEPN